LQPEGPRGGPDGPDDQEVESEESEVKRERPIVAVAQGDAGQEQRVAEPERE